MNKATGNFVVNANGRRIAVVLAMREYKKLLAELEELESIRAYDAAKEASDSAIPFEKAVAELGRRR